jgi:hypothetical protein
MVDGSYPYHLVMQWQQLPEPVKITGYVLLSMISAVGLVLPVGLDGLIVYSVLGFGAYGDPKAATNLVYIGVFLWVIGVCISLVPGLLVTYKLSKN